MARTQAKKIAIYDNGSLLVPDIDILNFTGSGHSASITGVSPVEVTETISGGGGGGSITVYNDPVSGTIDGSNVTFTVPNTIGGAIALLLGNAIYENGVDYTFSSNVITFATAPSASLSDQPFWFSYAAAGSVTIFSDTVSGTIDGSNATFTVLNSISQSLILVLGNSSYQEGVDYAVSGNTITMAVAPSASLSGQPFWFSHT